MKIWITCLTGLCTLGIFVAKIEIRNFAFAQPEGIQDHAQLDKDVKLLYNRGKCGKVAFSPNTGHRIAWRLPEKTLPPPSSSGQRAAVTYGFSGGRLGDNLLSYLHARWIAYRDHVPLVYQSFPKSDEFALSLEPQSPMEGTPVKIPYFPEPTMKIQNNPFSVDWDDPGFREEIAKWLAPTKPHTLLVLPEDKITVCIHVRRGGAMDLPAHRHFPLKFPPDQFYIDQIRYITRFFQEKPLYVFLMTDDDNPEALVQRYQKAVSYSNIEWDYRKKPADSDLDDFFSIPLFDCLILGDSNFSITASKLTEYAIKIAPTHYKKKKGKVIITGLEITFNPAYRKVKTSREKILIAGVCRNTERAVPNVIRNAEALGGLFKDYAVLIYENNSSDNTAALYKEWAERNPHVVFESETLAYPAPSRTERIADARNKVLALARRPEYAGYRYLVMVDLDFITPWPIEQIVHAIERGGSWDAIAANGVYPNGDYYDRYALRTMAMPFGPELLGNWWRMQLENEPIRLTASQLIPAYSAFGGLAIYKTASILPFAYSGTVTKDLRDYYKQILFAHHGKKNNSQICEYVRQLGRKPTNNLKPVPIVFVENTFEEHSDEMRRATCCEHVPLYASMAMHGHSKIFIDPQMVFVNTPP